MPLYQFADTRPVLPDGGSCFIAPGAHVIGRVRLGNECSVWFNAVLRGDNEWIELGEGSNVQDGAILHTDPGFPMRVGAYCTIGHGAILHGCTIGDGTLIGMGAIILNGARIGRNCIVGAGALVTEGKEYPDRSLIVGSPARVVRELAEEARDKAARAHLRYIEKQHLYLRDLREIEEVGHVA